MTEGQAGKAMPGKTLRVAVLVDLHWSEDAGGHVKCWEKLARAATAHPDQLDMTVHFLGSETGVRDLAPNLSYRFHPPGRGTERYGFLAGSVPDHTDLASRNRSLEEALDDCDVIHTTMTGFAFSRSAERVAQRRGVPLVNSIHTDLPGCGRVFGAKIIRRMTGKALSGLLLGDAIRLDRRIEAGIARKLSRHQRKCAHVLVSKPEDFGRAAALMGEDRTSYLRRGIDTDLFSPARRDRDWLAREFGIAPERVVVLFAGRINVGKNIDVLAEAVRRLADGGAPVCLFCAGDGEDRERIARELGRIAVCPGILDPDTLARVYAASDVFATASRFEVLGNVVLEALASGLPVAVDGESGMGRVVVEGETGFVISEPGVVEAWQAVLGRLAQDSALRARMGRAARDYAERSIPTWDDVLLEDLFPVWRQAVVERG